MQYNNNFNQMKPSLKANNFIAKLDSIIKDPNFSDIIKFDPPKAKIYIYDKQRFQAQILPFYYRHSNLTSFIRQLNLYGFKNIKTDQQICFTHPLIQQGASLLSIKAKKKVKNEESSLPNANQLPQNHHYIPWSYYRQPGLQIDFQTPNYLFESILPKTAFSEPSGLQVRAGKQNQATSSSYWNFQSSTSILLMPIQYGYCCPSFYGNSVPPN